MPGKFECLGFPDEGLKELILKAAAQARPIQLPGFENRHHEWRDPSGACMFVHAAESAIECVTLFYRSSPPSRWRVRTTGPLEDERCLHCGGADCDLLSGEEILTRACIQWVLFAPNQGRLAEEQEFDLEVAAFAHEWSFHADPGAFEESLVSKGWGVPAGPEGKPLYLFPVGMFSKENAANVFQRATSSFGGHVRSAARKVNSLTGLPFLAVEVKTLPGLITVVGPDRPELPKPGSIAVATAWLVGRQ